MTGEYHRLKIAIRKIAWIPAEELAYVAAACKIGLQLFSDGAWYHIHIRSTTNVQLLLVTDLHGYPGKSEQLENVY